MIKVISVVFLCILFFSVAVQASEIRTIDVNKDGKPDVTYEKREEFATKVSADTNYDGNPDVVVYVENGKFDSAEVDTDYDGKVDKKFTDQAQFKQWVNNNRPDFNDSLGWEEWSRVNSKVFWKPGTSNQNG